MSAVIERSSQVLHIPEQKHLQMIRRQLVSYRGKVAIIMKNSPKVSILGKVCFSGYDNENECVVMSLSIGKGVPPLVILIYPKDVRNYYIFGVYDLVHDASRNETGNDCPSSIRLLN